MMLAASATGCSSQEARKPQRGRRDARPLLDATSGRYSRVLLAVAVLVVVSTYAQVRDSRA